MKKRLVVCLFISVMALSFVIPAMAAEKAVTVAPTSAVTEYEIAPRTEVTRIYWRTYSGQLQWRVWGVTSGRWITEWANL